MNREFAATSKLTRTVSLVSAIVSTVLIVSGIGGLAAHYSSDIQVAAKEAAVHWG